MAFEPIERCRTQRHEDNGPRSNGGRWLRYIRRSSPTSTGGSMLETGSSSTGRSAAARTGNRRSSCMGARLRVYLSRAGGSRRTAHSTDITTATLKPSPTTPAARSSWKRTSAYQTIVGEAPPARNASSRQGSLGFRSLRSAEHRGISAHVVSWGAALAETTTSLQSTESWVGCDRVGIALER
jgi:hypothetical protein